MSHIQLTANLLSLRKSIKKTQKEIAAMLNISRQAYSNYETGKRMPDPGLLIQISDIYSISVDALLTQTFTLNGIVNERKGPYSPAMEIDTANTLYLTKEEVAIIMNYRKLTPDNKLIVDRFLKQD